jgi:hypothetical protein
MSNGAHRRGALSFLAALAMLAASGGESNTTAQSVELRGRVVDLASGAPLADAIVRLPLQRRYTLTNEAGEFRIADVPLGAQTVVVVQIGYGDRSLRIDVQPDGYHVIELEVQPIRLDAIVATDTRRIEQLMNAAAQTRATILGGAPRLNREPVFWNSWERDRIRASGIDDPLLFLSRGPPRISIRKCVGLDQPPDRLCVGVPFDGIVAAGFSGGASGSRRLSSRLRLRAPSTRIVQVFLDDRPIGPIENLANYSMDDFYRVETYGYRGESGIRLYTEGYLRLVAAGVVTPDPGSVADQFVGRTRDERH